VAVRDYLRTRFMPHLWCPGCGHGIVLGSLLRAIEALGLSRNEIVMVSGIGCSSRITGYVDFHTLHTLHGRALAFATGVKLSRPELTTIVPMGDGDALAIGGNHFIHAARRNIDITAIVMNNETYGMTGGQFSPLSDCGVSATTAPYGNIDRPFDTVELARSAGATYVARTTTGHVQHMTRILQEAIRHRGFAVVEVMSQCPTYFGRRNRMGDAVEMLKYLKDHALPLGRREPGPGDFEIGVFVQEDRPEYCDEYRRLEERARPRAGRQEEGESRPGAGGAPDRDADAGGGTGGGPGDPADGPGDPADGQPDAR
jgi:2-oxoglutarate ferredoxin oxidoreductase subunit beta